MLIARVHCKRLPDTRNTACRQAAKTRGVTLVELIVTMAVFAILVSLAAPSFFRLLASNRMSTQTNEFVSGLRLAQSEAMRRGQTVTLRSLDDDSQINFHEGWQVFTDGNADGAAAATEADGAAIRDSGVLAGSTTVTRVTRSGTAGSYTYAAASSSLTTRQFVTFNSRGGTQGGVAAFFRVCDSADITLPGRIVHVSTVGRVSVDSTNENCAL